MSVLNRSINRCKIQRRRQIQQKQLPLEWIAVCERVFFSAFDHFLRGFLTMTHLAQWEEPNTCFPLSAVLESDAWGNALAQLGGL